MKEPTAYRDGYEESLPPNGSAGGYWDKRRIADLPEGDAMTLEQLAKQVARDIWGVRPDKQEAIILEALQQAAILKEAE